METFSNPAAGTTVLYVCVSAGVRACVRTRTRVSADSSVLVFALVTSSQIAFRKTNLIYLVSTTTCLFVCGRLYVVGCMW